MAGGSQVTPARSSGDGPAADRLSLVPHHDRAGRWRPVQPGALVVYRADTAHRRDQVPVEIEHAHAIRGAVDADDPFKLDEGLRVPDRMVALEPRSAQERQVSVVTVAK